MRHRPLPVTVAVVLSLLLCLFNAPWPWMALFPGVEGPPDWVLYAGYVLGIVGLVAAVGLWMLKRWSFWATIAVSALNFLLALPGVFEAPTPPIRAVVALNAIVALLVIVLVVQPASRRALEGVPSPEALGPGESRPAA